MSLPDATFLRLKELLVEERIRRKAAERRVAFMEQEIIILRARRINVARTAEKRYAAQVLAKRRQKEQQP